MSCASDSILFLLQIIYHQIPLVLKPHLLQQLHPQINDLFNEIDIVNPVTWSTYIIPISDHIYSGEERRLRGFNISLSLVLHKLLLSTNSSPTIFTCFNKKHLTCKNNHTSNKNTHMNIITSIISPTQYQTLEGNIMQSINNIPKRTTNCRSCNNPHKQFNSFPDRNTVRFFTWEK